MTLKGLASILFLLIAIFFYLSYCSPISDELPKEDKVTPKVYVDRFTFKIETKTLSPNESVTINQTFGPEINGTIDKGRAHLKIFPFEVKAIMPGDKTMKQNNYNDDNDYNHNRGVEYEDLEYSNNYNTGKKKVYSKQDSVPMVIVRELNMVAMEIPMKDKHRGEKEWSEWSACSETCGDGLQRRWRFKPELEDQVRICHYADCGSSDRHFFPKSRNY